MGSWSLELARGWIGSLLTRRRDRRVAPRPTRARLDAWVTAFARSSAPLVVALACGAAAAAPPSAFQPHENPFAYAREYRDPLSGAVYLRARWYHPAVPTFLSRDPVDQINRYGYGGGNPVMRVDPSGRNYRAFAHDLGDALHVLNGGVGGHFARVFLAPAMGLLQIVAAPQAFWHSLRHNTAGIDAFLAGGAVIEAAAPFVVPYARTAVRFALRLGAESALGIGASVASADTHGHFNAGALVQGLEYTFGPIMVGRLAAGLGYQPYNLSLGQARDISDRFFKASTFKRAASIDGDIYEQPHEAIFFRVRQTRGRFSRPVGWTSPLQETFDAGAYHESLIAVTRDAVHIVDPVGRDDIVPRPGSRNGFFENNPLGNVRFDYAGATRQFRSYNLAISTADTPSWLRRAASGGETFCHRHVSRLLAGLYVRR